MSNFRKACDKAVHDALNVNSMMTLAFDDPEVQIGGVFNMTAEEDVAPPYIIFQSISEVDGHSLSVRFPDAIYLVKGVSKSPWPLEAIDMAGQIFVLMQDAALSITGFNTIGCRRQQSFGTVEIEGSIMYQHIGGLYRIEAEEL